MKSLAIGLAAVLLAAAPADLQAQGTPGPDAPPGSGGAPSATDRLQEGAAAIVEGLRLLMDQLQSYQPPEILPNGDIIIRRRPPATEPTPEKDAPKESEDKPLRL